VCNTELTACGGNQDCIDLNTCWSNCSSGDTACFSACDAQYPAGVDPLNALYSCLICNPDACSIDCDAATNCG